MNRPEAHNPGAGGGRSTGIGSLRTSMPDKRAIRIGASSDRPAAVQDDARAGRALHGDDDLAAGVSLPEVTDGVRNPAELVGPVDHRRDLPDSTRQSEATPRAGRSVHGPAARTTQACKRRVGDQVTHALECCSHCAMIAGRRRRAISGRYVIPPMVQTICARAGRWPGAARGTATLHRCPPRSGVLAGARFTAKASAATRSVAPSSWGGIGGQAGTCQRSGARRRVGIGRHSGSWPIALLAARCPNPGGGNPMTASSPGPVL